MAALRIKFYGTRGSIPVCDTNFQEFGGNTTCIAFYPGDNNRVSIMDAGTGIRMLGKEMPIEFPDQTELNITFSHFHWDHIQGFPFFDPAYNPNMNININMFERHNQEHDLHKIFATQMQEEYFPIELDKMGCSFSFIAHKEGLLKGENYSVESIELNHPGGSHGFRIEILDKAVVVCTDHELGDSIEQKYIDFAKNADILIHDAQYTEEELKSHKGWGHSSYDQVITLAKRAGVKQLVMTHHDPDHDDAFLKNAEAECKTKFDNVVFAREGMELEV